MASSVVACILFLLALEPNVPNILLTLTSLNVESPLVILTLPVSTAPSAVVPTSRIL